LGTRIFGISQGIHDRVYRKFLLSFSS
jgi:hypothetical protein